MAIGRWFKKQATRQNLKRAVNEASKQMLKKAAEKAVEKAEEKGAEKIQTVLWGTKKTPPRGKPHTPKLSTESRQKLKNMLTSGVPHTPRATKLSGDSRKKLNQILNLGQAAKLKVNQYLAEN